MYLSRLVLNQRLRQVRYDLSNPYEMHRTLSWAFAATSDEQPARFLWRLEPTLAGGSAVILVQSDVRPRWERIEQRFPGYLAEEAVKSYGLEELFRPGRALRFRLAANPTVTRDGKRKGLRNHVEQVAWLHRQGERHGFKVLGCTVSQSGLLRARQEGKRGGNPITVQVVTYDGYLQVHDPALLKQTIGSGLGHAKALGLGLLSVAPAGK